MGYSLGIDVGASFVAAAAAGDGLEMVPLVDGAGAAPAVVGVLDDGRVVTGAAAAREGARRPDHVVREIREALGRGQPVRLGDRQHDAGELLGALLRDSLAHVTDRRGAAPDAVALTCPAAWDADRRASFQRAAAAAGLGTAVWTTEPQAAAACYASGRNLSPGDVVAVYDLGGRTFDATVLRRTEDGFEVIGTPEQVEGVAGSRFDEAVLGRVNDLSFGALDDLDTRDPEAIAALDRLRQDCARAKEKLSTEPETTISVSLPNQRSDVSLTRGELETLIQAPVESTIDTLDQVLQSAGVSPGNLAALLMVGGSSNIPLVAHRLAEAFGRPTVVGPRPEQAVALGAALIARAHSGRAPAAVPSPAPAAPVTAVPVAPAAAPEPVPAPEPTPAPAPAPAPVVEPAPAARVPAPAEAPPQEQAPAAAQAPARDQPPERAPEPPQEPAPAPLGAPGPAFATPDAGPARGPVVVPTKPRRAQKVPVVPARGGRPRTVAAPPGGEVSHLPAAAGTAAGAAAAAAAGAGAAAAAPAQAPFRAPEQPGRQSFAPGNGPAPAEPPQPRSAAPPAASWAAPPATAAAPRAQAPPRQAPQAPPGQAPPGQGPPNATFSNRPPGGTQSFGGVAPPPGGGQGAGPPPGRFEPSGGSPIPPPPPTAQRSNWRLPLIVGLVVVVLVAAGVVGYLLLKPSGSKPPAQAASKSSAAHSSGSAKASPTQSGPAVATAVPIPSLGATVQVGQTPNFAVAAPNDRQIYVANTAAGVVSVVDTAVNKVTATIPISAGPPQFLAFSPNGERLYVSVWNTARTIAAVTVLDTTSNSVVATIPVHTRPFLPAVSPDGKRVYVPNHDTGTVSVIDATTNKLLTDFSVPANPHSISFTPDGKRIYIADHESNLVSVVDTATNKVIATVPVPPSPHNVQVHPTRPLAVVASYDGKSVTAINTDTNTVIATIPVGLNPQNVAYSADGRFVYITNNGDNTVSVINLDTMAVTATIPVGKSPTSLAVMPDGKKGYVSNLDDGTLTALHLSD